MILPRGSSVGRTYRAERKTLRTFAVCWGVFFWLAMLIVVAAASEPDVELDAVVLGLAIPAIAVSVALWFVGRIPLSRLFTVEEVRIAERVITRRGGPGLREIWLGDVTHVAWKTGEGPPHVVLRVPDGEFKLAFDAFPRSYAVEIIEWMRWGVAANEENWPRFCHYFALPLRGFAERPLRSGERRRRRRAFDRPCAAAAALFAIGGAVGWWWTGQMLCFLPLALVPAVWVCRFLLPHEGKIVWRAPRMPRYYRWLAAVLSMTVTFFGLLLTMSMWKTREDLGAGLFLASAIGLIVLLLFFNRRQKQFAAEQEPRWLAKSMRTWDSEAKSGAWSIERASRDKQSG